MLTVVLNFLLYLSVLFFHWKRYRAIDNGFILLATYSFVALMCIFNYMSTPASWEGLTFFPLIYLFIVNLLFFRPYLINNNKILDKISVKKSAIYFIFIYLYIFFAGIVLYYGYDSAVETILRNDWNAVRADVYAGDNVVYENQLERFAKVFTGFLQPMAILFFFYLLTEEFAKKRMLMILLLLFAILIPSFLTIISIASRGLVIVLLIQFFVTYLIFKKNISKKTNKVIRLSSLVFIVAFLAYTISVTNSRFGKDAPSSISGTAENSLVFYFGHSMITFAYGLTDSIREFLWGKYLFGDENILRLGIDNSLGTHFDTNFFTYVGALYLDFGPFFTFIIALFFPFFMNIIFSYRKKLDMADLVIYTYYLTFLINGVFVIGIGYYLGWLMIFIIYIIFKIIKLIT